MWMPGRRRRGQTGRAAARKEHNEAKEQVVDFHCW
jgi:hypothetical protein